MTNFGDSFIQILNHYNVHLKITQYCKSIILQKKKKKGKLFPLGLQGEVAAACSHFYFSYEEKEWNEHREERQVLEKVKD